jgi:hypothetical protein
MTAVLPAEVCELLNVVMAAIDIPYPATVGDEACYQEVLAERVMHAVITLRGVLSADQTPSPAAPAWYAADLREQLAAHPPAGYKTGPWPGTPVDASHRDARGGERR